MNSLYHIRVLLVSLEALIILVSLLGYVLLADELYPFFSALSLNSEALKWVIAYPLLLGAWIFKEGVGILFPDENLAAFLHKWPDYWRLKAHFNIGILYCVILVLPCIVIWLINKSDTLYGIWILVTCCIALSVNAYSFYTAKIHIKSRLLQAEVK